MKPKSHNWFPQEIFTKVVPYCLPDRCRFLTCFDRITYSLGANGKEREGWSTPCMRFPMVAIIIIRKTLLLFPTIHNFFFFFFFFLSRCPGQACEGVWQTERDQYDICGGPFAKILRRKRKRKNADKPKGYLINVSLALVLVIQNNEYDPLARKSQQLIDKAKPFFFSFFFFLFCLYLCISFPPLYS